MPDNIDLNKFVDDRFGEGRKASESEPPGPSVGDGWGGGGGFRYRMKDDSTIEVTHPDGKVAQVQKGSPHWDAILAERVGKDPKKGGQPPTAQVLAGPDETGIEMGATQMGRAKDPTEGALEASSVFSNADVQKELMWEGGGGFKFYLADPKTIEVTNPAGKKVKVVKGGQNGEHWDAIMAERQQMTGTSGVE